MLDGDNVNYDMERGFTRHPIEDNNDKGNFQTSAGAQVKGQCDKCPFRLRANSRSESLNFTFSLFYVFLKTVQVFLSHFKSLSSSSKNKAICYLEQKMSSLSVKKSGWLLQIVWRRSYNTPNYLRPTTASKLKKT